MKRLRIVAEGDSEVAFCKALLIPYLANFGVYATVSMIETSRLRRRPDVRFKGGIPAYEHLYKDVRNFLVHDSDPELRVTTLIDYFHLPTDFPGLSERRANMTRDEEIKSLEEALARDIGDARFIPYIQKHEFETFIFVDIMRLEALYPGHQSKIERLKRGMRGAAPEDVNGGDQTSPSNRILKEFPEHARNKPRIVPMLSTIGMEGLLSACPHFASWVTSLTESEDHK